MTVRYGPWDNTGGKQRGYIFPLSPVHLERMSMIKFLVTLILATVLVLLWGVIIISVYQEDLCTVTDTIMKIKEPGE